MNEKYSKRIYMFWRSIFGWLNGIPSVCSFRPQCNTNETCSNAKAMGSDKGYCSFVCVYVNGGENEESKLWLMS